MNKDLLEELQSRGLVQQYSNLECLKKKQSFYLGIDPTAASIHCGHLLPVILAKRLALAGHQPILLIGSGTAKIGDPSGKSEMRKMLSTEEIDAHAVKIRKQLEYIFSDCPRQPIWLDNKAWLDQLNYIDFLREVGRHFSVNRMLAFESCKQRLERGLSFIEFNYQLLQSYDYWKLFKDYDCLLQIGGDDQWGNMLAGIDLIRRSKFLENSEITALPQALTVPLITTSDGKKMGKSERGAVFIDVEQTSAFDFFQYWRNCSDDDVQRFLLLFSFLPVEAISELCKESGAALNQAKEILAYQMCLTVHGQEEADKALSAAKASFGGEGNGQMPGAELEAAKLQQGIDVLSLYMDAGLCSSRNEARRLIQGGGASINGKKIDDAEQIITESDLAEGHLLLKAGKKRFFRFSVRYA